MICIFSIYNVYIVFLMVASDHIQEQGSVLENMIQYVLVML